MECYKHHHILDVLSFDSELEKIKPRLQLWSLADHCKEKKTKLYFSLLYFFYICTYIILKELSTQLGGENITSAEFMVILLIDGFLN